MSGKGHSLTIPEKEMVIRIKQYFDEEVYHQEKEQPFQSTLSRTALATNLSEITVKRIMAEHNKGKPLSPPLQKGSSPYAINEGIKTICQNIIRSYNIRREHLSLRLLVGVLNDLNKIEVARETLRTHLYKWNIVNGRVQRHTALRERDYVVNALR